MEKARRGKNRNREQSATGFFSGRWHDSGLSGVIGILGQPGVGKSYTAQAIIRPARRVIFFDTVLQAGSGPRQNPLPGFVRLTQPGELVAFLRTYRQGSFRVLYAPISRAAEHFDHVARLVLAVRDTVFCVDEVWRFCRAGSWMPEPLETMAFAGRHFGVTLIYTAQRPAKVAKDLISISTELKVFRLTLGHDLRALDDANLSPDAIAQIPSLPDRVYIERDHLGNCRRCG